MLLDEDPSHTAAGSYRAAERWGIELIWLPKRAPELNPMEPLRGHGKEEVGANQQRESIDDHVGRFLRITPRTLLARGAEEGRRAVGRLLIEVGVVKKLR
jgi:hypothetical protein